MINVVLALVLDAVQVQTYGLEDTVSLILALMVSIYFFKKAINRDYKNFRLSAHPRGGNQN